MGPDLNTGDAYKHLKQKPNEWLKASLATVASVGYYMLDRKIHQFSFSSHPENLAWGSVKNPH